MAVKKHELVHDNRNQVLKALAQYIQLMNEQPHYLPPPSELIKNCQNIVKCLARARDEEDHLWELLQSVEDFLVRMINLVHQDVRHEVITAILEKFYYYISDPQSEACPATSVVLIVLATSDNEATMFAARWLVQHVENGPAAAGLRASLACLYKWLHEWHGTPTLGDWVMAFIKALEENEHFEILIEVSMENLETLFKTLEMLADLRQSVADVILHVLSSLRESMEALDKVSAHVERVLVNLASDSGQFSRQLLQNVVDVLTAFFDYLSSTLKGDALETFKNKHSDVMVRLGQHMPSRNGSLMGKPWPVARAARPVARTTAPVRTVGLLNLGNTCYMNSVIQALLVTRTFSTHVMLRMSALPYWSKMGILFAKMMFSVANEMNPDEFLEEVKPPFFTNDTQHDSSEFLGYLFELMKSFEHSSEALDYKKSVQLNNTRKNFPPWSSTNEIDQVDSSNTRRSVSPRPGGSGAGSKRSHAQAELDNVVPKKSCNSDSVVPKKRLRISEPNVRRESFIDALFGGVLITRVECTQCRSFSVSRDVFRDLQLAYPEKREGLQHNVQSLLEFYCSKERLSGDNQYECHDCGGLRDAERSVLVETTPKYLILVLKNFKFDPKLGVQAKLMQPIYHNYTVSLPTAAARQSAHATYSLYAAVVHNGTTLDSGHYYTLAKDAGRWHMYNDEVVSPADEKHVNTLPRCHTPYILFYRRADVEEEPAPSLAELPQRLQQAVAAHNKHYVDQPSTTRKTVPL